MERIHPVHMGKICVGEVMLRSTGLYYDVCCRCKLPENTLYRLQMQCNEEKTDLGILVPEKGEFVTKTRIAARKLICEDVGFYIITAKTTSSNVYITIDPEEKFTQLPQLEQLCLVRRGDKWLAARGNSTDQSFENV